MVAEGGAQGSAADRVHGCEDTARLPTAVYEARGEVHYAQAYRWLPVRRRCTERLRLKDTARQKQGRAGGRRRLLAPLHLREQPSRHRARLGTARRDAHRERLPHNGGDRHRRQPAHLSLDQAACAHEQGVHRAPLAHTEGHAGVQPTDEQLHPLRREHEAREHLDSPARGTRQGQQRPHPGRRAEDAGHGR